jgi:hypothetical protein
MYNLLPCLRALVLAPLVGLVITGCTDRPPTAPDPDVRFATAEATLELRVTPEFAHVRVGTPYTLIATLTRNGRPVVGGVVIIIDATTGEVLEGGGRTDARGKFSFTYTRTDPGLHILDFLAGAPDAGSAEVSAFVDWVESGVPRCGMFCFLPPTPGVDVMPRPSGPFHGRLSPTLLICELNGTSCRSGEYKAGFLTNIGTNRIRVHEDGEFYWVEFEASRYGFDPAKRYRIQVFSLGQRIGQQDVTLPDSGSVEIRFRIQDD